MDAERRDDLRAVCAAIALRLPPGTVFSHVTAARLWRLPLPITANGPAPAPAGGRLRDADPPWHVLGPPGDRPLDVRGVVAHRGVAPHDVTVLRGIPVTTPVRTWLDLATLDLRTFTPRGRGAPTTARRLYRLPDGSLAAHPSGVDLAHEDLVAVTDALLGERLRVSRATLERALNEAAGRRGTRAARRALADARAFVDSAMETSTRLRLVASGFPVPVIGADLYDENGAWVSRPDLSWPALRIGIEYDGGTHVDRARLARDVARRDAMDRYGWRSIVLFAQDVDSRWPATWSRVAEAFAERGCPDPRALADAPDAAVRPRLVCRRP
jgi:hypothetical protein